MKLSLRGVEAAAVLLFTKNAISACTTPRQMICNAPVVARLPPSLKSTMNPYFIDTPRGYFNGLWYETYSSVNYTQLGLRSFQLLSVYNITADTTTDLTSYQEIGCPHVYTVYATDADSPSQDDNHPLHLPGTNTTVKDDIVAYGIDTNCHQYYVSYGPAPIPSLTIGSQIQQGPSNATLADIVCAFSQLGNENITALAKAIQKTPDDGTRPGFPDFMCGDSCKLTQTWRMGRVRPRERGLGADIVLKKSEYLNCAAINWLAKIMSGGDVVQKVLLLRLWLTGIVVDDFGVSRIVDDAKHTHVDTACVKM